tara:strand:- start:26 stop:484 length:459 start_codon:yes stop_codon:yes gene_type:complete
MDKLYFSYQDIHDLCIKLGNSISNKFEPDYILAISGGGLIPGRIIRKVLKKPVISVNISYYDSDDNIQSEPQIIQWIDSKIIENKKILIIDEIDDTGKTISYLINKLQESNVSELGIGVLHNKLKPKEYNLNNIKYFCGSEIPDKWVVYPWE